MRQAGISETQITENLRRHNLEAPVDTRNEHEIRYDTAFPPIRPGDLRPQYASHPPAGDIDLPAFDGMVQEAGVAMGVEPRTFEHLIEQANDLERWYSKASEVDKELFAREEKYKLIERFGPEGVQLHLDLAEAALRRAPEAFRTWYLKSGAAQSAEQIRWLAHGEARLSRRSTG
jgi:hypothetical protein